MVLGTVVDVVYVQMPKWQELTPYSSTNGHSNQDEHVPLIPETAKAAARKQDMGNNNDGDSAVRKTK